MIQTTRAKLSELRAGTISINKGVRHMLASTFWWRVMQACIKKLRHIPSM